MSIFKSVKEAESKADNIKNEALENVNRLLDDARIKGEIEAKKISALAFEKEKALKEETSKKISEIKQKVLNEAKHQSSKLENIATKNRDKTISYIIEKVFSL